MFTCYDATSGLKRQCSFNNSSAALSSLDGDKNGTYSFTPSANGSYTLTVNDMAGHSASETVQVDFYDNDAPTLTNIRYNGNASAAATNAPVTVSFDVADVATLSLNPDYAGVASVTVVGNKRGNVTVEDFTPTTGTNACTVKFTAPQNEDFAVTVVDKAGNSALYTFFVDCIDTVPPTIDANSIVLNRVNISNVGALNSQQRVVIQVSDTADDNTGAGYIGVDRATVNGEPANLNATYTEVYFDADQNGDYTVVVYDKANNSSSYTFSLDSFDLIDPNVEDFKVEGIPVGMETSPFKGPVEIEVTASDQFKDRNNHYTAQEYCGIKSVTVTDETGYEHYNYTRSAQAAAPVPSAGEVFTGTFSVSENHAFTVVVTDVAGNKRTEWYTLRSIDQAAPVEYSNVTVDGVPYANRVASKNDVVVSFTAKDAISVGQDETLAGIKEVSIQDGNGASVTPKFRPNHGIGEVSISFTATKCQSYYVTLTDYAGNEYASTTPIVIDNIDKQAPVGISNVQVNGVAIENAAVTTGSDIIVFFMQDNNVDSEGNVTGDAFSGATHATVTGATDQQTYADEDRSHIAGIGNSTIMVMFATTKNQTYNVTITDRAGNVTQQTIVVNNIDAAKPAAIENVQIDGIAYADRKPSNTEITVSFTVKDVPEDAVKGLAADKHSGVANVKVTGADNVEYIVTAALPTNGAAEAVVSFTTLKNQTYTITMTDKAGNVRDDQTIIVDNIDAVIPADITNVQLDDKPYADRETTKGKVKVSFTAKDVGMDETGSVPANGYFGIKKIEVIDENNVSYPITGTMTTDGNQETTVSFMADANQKYLVVLTDKAGNPNVNAIILVDNIDTQAPAQISDAKLDGADAANRLPTNTAVEVEFTAKDVAADDANKAAADKYAGLASVKVAGEDGTPCTATVTPKLPVDGENAVGVKFTADKNQKYFVTLEDKAGNTSTQTITVDNIDMKMPDVISNVMIDGNAYADRDPAWGEVEVTFAVKDIPADAGDRVTADPYSGVASVKVVGEDKVAYIATATLPTSGAAETVAAFKTTKNQKYTITLTDKAGNVRSDQTILVDNIDTQKPKALSKVKVDGKAYADRQPSNKKVTVSFDTADVFTDDEGSKTSSSLGGIVDVIVINAAQESYDVTYNDTVGAEVCHASFETELNGVYTVIVTDRAGNEYREDILLDCFDAQAAHEIGNITFDALPQADRIPVSGNVVVTFDVFDQGGDGAGVEAASTCFGIKSVTLADADGKAYKPTFTATDGTAVTTVIFTADENKTYFITITDKAGNVLEQEITVDNIDRGAPANLSVIYDAVTYMPSTEGVKVSFSADDSASTDGKKHSTAAQFLGITAKVEGPGVTQLTTVTANKAYSFVATANGKYTITLTDRAGNAAVYSFDLDRIDDEAPKVQIRSAKATVYADAQDNGALVNMVVMRNGGIMREVSCKRASSYQLTVPMTSGGVYSVMAMDEAGNVNTVSIIVQDSDNDGLADEKEKTLGTNPQNADSDGDGLTDGEEYLKYHTDPLEADTDGDGLTDGREIGLGLNPLKKDTDGDGVTDEVEVALGLLDSKLNAAADLLLDQSLTNAGVKVPVSLFGQNGGAAFDNLVSHKVITALKMQDLTARKEQAQKDIKTWKNPNATLVQFDMNTDTGLAVTGSYLVSFGLMRGRTTINRVIDLSVFGELTEGMEWIVFPSTDGIAAIVARWDGEKAVDDLGLLVLEGDRCYPGIFNDSKNATCFAIAQDASMVSYFKNGKLTLINLASGEKKESDMEKVVSLTFADGAPIAVTEDGRAWKAENDSWMQFELSIADMRQRTNRSRSVMLGGGQKQIDVTGKVYIMTNGTGGIRYEGIEGKAKIIYTIKE